MKRPLLLLAVLVALACTKEHRVPPVSRTAAEEGPAEEGGTLVRRLASDVNTLNPVLTTSKYDHLVFNYLFTPMVYLDANLQCIPGLADKWDISPDGKLYTFHLNPRATFDDGTPVRATDVIFTLKRILDPQSEAAELAGMFEQADLEHTKVIDDHTVAIAFKKALAPQLSHFNNFNVLPEHVYAQGDFLKDFNSRAVGEGPYRLIRRDAGREILVERREDYWGKKPYIKDVLFKVIHDDVTAWNAVKRGDIDESQITSDVWYMESSRPDLQRYIDFRRLYYLSYTYIGWNERNPILADKRVRQALGMCVDIKSIISNLYHGTARAMNGPFVPDQWAYNPTVPIPPYDPPAAKRLLASAGWLDTDGDGILDKNKTPLKFDMFVFAGSQISTQLAQLYQAELKKIGVAMNIVTLDPPVYFERLTAGNFEAVNLTWDLDPDPDPYPLYHSSQIPPHGQNFVYYSNPEADRLIDEGRTTLDQSKRVAIYQQLHAILAEDQPYRWTLQVSVKWAINKHVHGVAESKGYGLFLWYPGEFDWWIPKNQRTHEVAPPRG